MRTIAAGDIEKYAYCPLSWWLSLEGVDPDTGDGVRRHERLSETLHEIGGQEERGSIWANVVVVASIAAAALSLIGMAMLPFERPEEVSLWLVMISLPWIGLAVGLVWSSMTGGDDSLLRAEAWVVSAAAAATVLAFMSILIPSVSVDLAVVYELIALVWLTIACLAMSVTMTADVRASAARSASGIEGSVRYVGDDRADVLRSEAHGITGRPDYVVLRDGDVIPVEYKSGRVPRGPLFSHVMQLSAYCLLLEETLGREVPYGILSYGSIEHEVRFDEDTRALLLSMVDSMRSALASGDVHRNHDRPGKCRGCSRRERCPERLDAVTRR